MEADLEQILNISGRQWTQTDREKVVQHFFSERGFYKKGIAHLNSCGVPLSDAKDLVGNHVTALLSEPCRWDPEKKTNKGETILDKFEAYLTNRFRYLRLDYFKLRAKHVQVNNQSAEGGDGTRKKEIASGQPNPFEELLEKAKEKLLEAQLPKVWDCIDILPPRQQDALILFYFEEYGINEIAEMTDAKENTVRKRLHDARRGVAKCLEAKGISDLRAFEL